MNFKEALSKLNIEDYGERIFHSNSHGELFHCVDYIVIAEALTEKDLDGFRGWFENVVEWAEENWQRPESIFQHISKILLNNYSQNKAIQPTS